MSLLLFPDEVIHEIIYHLTSGSVCLNLTETSAGYARLRRPEGSFTPNTCKIPLGYMDLLALSTTCTRLRIMCGESLFSFISLVRRSEIDAILAYSTRMDKWSDSRGLHRQFMKEVLESNFSQCSEEELAKMSFRPSVNGDKHFWSKYQRTFSVNHYVTELEISNESLKNGDLSLFPALASLQVLDKPARIELPRDSVAAFGSKLKKLAINLETLLGCGHLLRLLPQLHELNLICDIHSLIPNASLTELKKAFGNRNKLSIFTFFVTDPDLLQYTEYMDFLHHILATGIIKTFILRLTRKVGLQATAKTWEVFDRAEKSWPAFVNALNSCNTLNSVMIDFDLISRLLFPLAFVLPERESPFPPHVSFYLIDYSLSVPKLLFRPREIVANIIQAIRATEVVFIYGEVIDQSHLHAIGVMSNLLMYLASDSHRASPYIGVAKVSMEKAWSTSDDSLVRHHYESLIDSYEAADKGTADKKELASRIVNVSLGDHHVFSSPRYRRREEYSVVAQKSSHGDTMPIMLPTFKLQSRDYFWAAESMLRDLEHYCMREKALSSIWD